MRRNQLSFSIENFDKQGNTKVHGYIDANNMAEVLHDMLLACRDIYAPEMPAQDFFKSVTDFSEPRFGRTNIYGSINGHPIPAVDKMNGYNT